jgi:DNA-binding NarL/FixJ family response regulator
VVTGRHTVAIAEDHPVFRRELVVALERDPHLQVVAEAPDLGRLMSRLAARPSLLLVDLSAPGRPVEGALTRLITPLTPPVLAMVGAGDDPGPALLAGVAGAVAKSELLLAGPELARRTVAGEPLVGAEAGRALLRLARQAGLALSPRQEELLVQLAAGRDLAELENWMGGARADTHRLVASTIIELRSALRAERRPGPPDLPPASGPPPPSRLGAG